jgi:hypothetical protein
LKDGYIDLHNGKDPIVNEEFWLKKENKSEWLF